jgi:hypothetical protein
MGRRFLMTNTRQALHNLKKVVANGLFIVGMRLINNESEK